MVERDIYEVANQLQGYVDEGTPEKLADTIVLLRAELEQVKRERDYAVSEMKEARIYRDIETGHAEDAESRAEKAEAEIERLAGARVKALRELIASYRTRFTDEKADYQRGILDTLDNIEMAMDGTHDAGPPLAKPAREAEPDFAASIAEVIKEESLNEAACGWRSCTGCHETNEGYETGLYPYSTMFGCHVGHGCSECGGLGVVWEYWSKDALDDMASDVTTPPDASAIREALEASLETMRRYKRAGYGDEVFMDDLCRSIRTAEAALAGAKP